MEAKINCSFSRYKGTIQIWVQSIDNTLSEQALLEPVQYGHEHVRRRIKGTNKFDSLNGVADHKNLQGTSDYPMELIQKYDDKAINIPRITIRNVNQDQIGDSDTNLSADMKNESELTQQEW